MSTTVFSNSNTSPIVTRRPPLTNEDIGTGSQRNTNRRSLSVKLRDLFRRNSSASNRTGDNNRRSSPASGRQSSLSPSAVRTSTEAPHLQAPAIQWPFGKKKTKTSTTSTPTPSKTKTKNSRKVKQTPVPPMEISSPLYGRENQTFLSRSPDHTYRNTEIIQPPLNYERTITTEYRDYVVNDQIQPSRQGVVPDIGVYTPPIYTSDRSRSPSMYRQRSPDYRYNRDISTPPLSIPLADIEYIPTPQRKRKVDDNSSLTNKQILIDKPPVFPQTTSYPSSSIGSNLTAYKSTSSSTLNKTGKHSSTVLSTGANSPKLHAPFIPLGSPSSKKKPKPKKSKSPTNERTTSSSSTINNLVQLNPVHPNRSWTNTYGSLPDAEIIYGDSITSSKPTKPITKTYPGLSAIVRHHLGARPTVYYNEYPSPTIPTSPQRLQRFETSTTTLNEYEQNQPWPPPTIYGSAPSTYYNQHHDGYIRPLTPQKPAIHANINITYSDCDDIRRHSPTPQPTRYDSVESPPTYRSSTTVYTRDKQNYVPGGEIRTWSTQENEANDDYNNYYRKPAAYTEVERTHERETDRQVPPTIIKETYDNYNNSYRQPYSYTEVDRTYERETDRQVMPTTIKETYDDYRYSPIAHERDRYEKEQKVTENVSEDEEQEEEEKYEVTFEYQPKHQHFPYETKKHYDELQSTSRYSSNVDVERNSNYSKITPTVHSTNVIERDNTYDRSSRSQIQNEHTQAQETRYTAAPVKNFEPILHTYSIKLSKSYNGLGMSLAADAQTRLNHFIREVEPTSPSDQAGLRKNDRIISINGINVENVDFSNVLDLIKKGLDNDNLQISVIHQPEQ